MITIDNYFVLASTKRGEPAVKVGPAVKAMQELEAKYKAQTEPLTKAEKTALLDAKILAYRETEGKGVYFSEAEMRCLYGRWNDTALQQAPDQAQTAWADAQLRGRSSAVFGVSIFH